MLVCRHAHIYICIHNIFYIFRCIRMDAGMPTIYKYVSLTSIHLLHINDYSKQELSIQCSTHTFIIQDGNLNFLRVEFNLWIVCGEDDKESVDLKVQHTVVENGYVYRRGEARHHNWNGSIIHRFCDGIEVKRITSTDWLLFHILNH